MNSMSNNRDDDLSMATTIQWGNLSPEKKQTQTNFHKLAERDELRIDGVSDDGNRFLQYLIGKMNPQEEERFRVAVLFMARDISKGASKAELAGRRSILYRQVGCISSLKWHKKVAMNWKARRVFGNEMKAYEQYVMLSRHVSPTVVVYNGDLVFADNGRPRADTKSSTTLSAVI